MQRAMVAVGMLIAGLVGGTGIASATSHDPTGGAFATSVDSVKTWISSVGAGPLFTLAAVALVIAVGLSWVRKARSQGT